MSSLEEEVSNLRKQNHELVKAVQNWKMVAGEREKYITKLTKEASDLRIQLSILRNKGSTCAEKLEAALQVIGETALSHLVQGSNAVAGMMELIRNYMIDREKIEISSRQTVLDSTPNIERVQKVRPLMLGGKYIQPVVSLSRAMLPNYILTETQSAIESHNGPVRPLPMRVLPEVYIPLTRIDADLINQSDEMENNHGTSVTSVEDMGLDEENDAPEQEDDANLSTDDLRELTVVLEEQEEGTPIIENPLEGPSRQLDSLNFNGTMDQSAHAFTPTMRRRKRPSSPEIEPSPILVARNIIPRYKANERILKVLVPKMRLDDAEIYGMSPPKKQLTEAGHSEQNRSLQNKWDRPGTSQDSHASPREMSSTTRNEPLSPWEKPNSDKTVLPWDRPGSSRDKHVSPWNTPGSSHNEINLSWTKTETQTVKSSVQIKNEFDEVPSTVSSSHRRQNRSPSNSKPADALKVIRDVTRRRPKDSPGKLNVDIYRFSFESQNSDQVPVFDAPSPNGSTNTRVIVQETPPKIEPEIHRVKIKRSNSTESVSECSDSVPETRTRRARKPVTYKETIKGKLRR